MTIDLNNHQSGNPLDERILAAANAAAEASTQYAEFRAPAIPKQRVLEVERSSRARLVVAGAFAGAICLLIAVLVVALPSTRSGTNGPTNKGNSKPLTPSLQVVASPSIDFVNERTGYLVVPANTSGPKSSVSFESTVSEIMKTVDGGVNWVSVFRSGAPLAGVDFINAEVGWAIGPSVLLHTVDGGRNWQRLFSQPAAGLVKVDFTSAADGWGVTLTGSLYATGDGGALWREVKTPATIDSECLAGPGQGWVVGSNYVDATTNNGASWTRQFALPGEQLAGEPTQLGCSSHSAAVAFNSGLPEKPDRVAVIDTFGTPGDSKWLDVTAKGSGTSDLYNSQYAVPGDYASAIASPNGQNVVVISNCRSKCLNDHEYVGEINVVVPKGFGAAFSSSATHDTLDAPGAPLVTAVTSTNQTEVWISILSEVGSSYYEKIYKSNNRTYQGKGPISPVKEILGWTEVASFVVPTIGG